MTAGAERARLLARMGIAVFVPRRAPPAGGSAPGFAEGARRRDPGASASAADAAGLPGGGGPRPAVGGVRRLPGAVEPEAVSRPAPGGPPAPSPPAPSPPAPAASAAAAARAPVSAFEWPELEAAVAGCTACPLHRSRNRTVFGAGARDPDWMVVGEGPGANEDRQGEPFVGRAGRLLDAMFFALGLARGEVFITNTVKCRPPRNRDPEPAEIERCAPFLDRQIELLSPRVILVVGRIAAQTILATDAPLARLRGREHRYPRGGRPVPVVATYHPAYLLRSPLAKRAAWEDLCLARSIAGRPR